MNEILKKLHNEPIDIYEEQKQLKDQLALNREVKIESRKLMSLDSMMVEQQESRETLIQKYYDIIKKREETIAGLNVELSGYFQKKEHHQATLPPSHEIMKLLDKMIISNQKSIEENDENLFELKQQLAELERHASIPFDIPDTNLTPNEYYPKAYEDINQARESEAIFSQGAANQEQHNLELKKKVETYAQMLKALKTDPMEIAHETLAQAYENVVKNHAAITEEYLGLFEEITTSFPKMLHNIANAAQYQTDCMVDIAQTIDATKDLDEKMRDARIVEDLLNGSIGKYMQGDLPFINYLNLRGELAVVDIEHVSKEVGLGKVKDRGVNYIIDLMEKNHKIILPFQDAFKLRLLLIEYHKVVEVSTKNNKLDYAKNYLNQHASLSAKALAAGVSVSPPLRNPSELKNLMQNILEQYSGADGYARDAMLELLDNGINRLPKKSPSK